jgi:hypothetical protein
VEPSAYNVNATTAKAAFIGDDDVALSLHESVLLLGALATLAASILAVWTL